MREATTTTTTRLLLLESTYILVFLTLFSHSNTKLRQTKNTERKYKQTNVDSRIIKKGEKIIKTHNI